MCSDCLTRWMAEQASSAELTDAVETGLEELPGTDLPCLAGHPYQARRASAAIEYAAAHPPVRADPGTPAGQPGRHRHGHRGRDPRCGRHARPRREPGRRAVRRDNRCGLPVPRRPVARRTHRRRRFRRQPRPSIARRTGKPAALSLNVLSQESCRFDLLLARGVKTLAEFVLDRQLGHLLLSQRRPPGGGRHVAGPGVGDDLVSVYRLAALAERCAPAYRGMTASRHVEPLEEVDDDRPPMPEV